MRQTLSHIIAPDEHQMPKPVELMRYHDQANAARLLDVLRSAIGNLSRVGTCSLEGSGYGLFTLEGTDGWDLYAATMFPRERPGIKRVIAKYTAEMQQGKFSISNLTFWHLDGEIYLTNGKMRLLAQGLAQSPVTFLFHIHRAESMDKIGLAYAYTDSFL